MCVYTGNCVDLMEKLKSLKEHKELLSPKLSKALSPVFTDIEEFMLSAIVHFDTLYEKRVMGKEDIEFAAWYDKNKDVYIGKIDIAKAAYFKFRKPHNK